MAEWRIVHGEILDVRADGLLCSANPSLNLSGGVGGAFLLRYGSEMQTFLHDHLRRNNLRYVSPENAVVAPSCGSPYQAVAHAVAIDAFYGTNNDRIVATYQAALNALARAGCRSVVSACLGCGYGRCSPTEFASAIQRVIAIPFDNLESVTLATTNAELAELLASVMRHPDVRSG